jgi:hypothetical protein
MSTSAVALANIKAIIPAHGQISISPGREVDLKSHGM